MAEQHSLTQDYETPYKFNGKELDTETGMYYYGARYYDPRASIWISVDPLMEKYPNVNPYVYCVQNPVMYTDPTGMSVEGDGDDRPNLVQRAWSAFKGLFSNENEYKPIPGKNQSTIEFGEPIIYEIPDEPVTTTGTTFVLLTESTAGAAIEASVTAAIETCAVAIEGAAVVAADAAAPVVLVVGFGGMIYYASTELELQPATITEEAARANGVQLCTAGNISGVNSYYSGTMTTGHFNAMAQRGQNNGKLQDDELESILARKAAGSASSADLQKLKRHEKNTGQRASRNSKDKK